MARFTQRRFKTHDGLTLVGDVGGNPKDPTILLLHGGGQTRNSWTKTMHRLVERGYFVINYDARGHGDSDWSPKGIYSIEDFSLDLRAIRETINGPVAIVGASMGGITSFYTVGMSNPPTADALVLVDIVLSAPPAGVARIRNFMIGHHNGFATLEEAVDAVAAYNTDRPRPKNTSGLRKNLRLREDGRYHWHWDPRMMSASPEPEPPTRAESVIQVSKGVTIPLLVVRGKRSDMVNDEVVAEIRRLVPQTEIYEVPDAGHMVTGDQNDVFSAGVLSFLDKHFMPRG
jgi:pimeloyl-ACP methyl ester carboxylesterase